MKRFLGSAAVILALSLVTSAQADLFQAARSDVKIEVTGHVNKKKMVGTCSGVYLGNGLIASTKHCFNGEGSKGFILDKVEVILDQNGKPGGKYEAHVEMSNKKADVSLLSVTKDLPADKAELACREPVIGEALELVGNPAGVEFIHTWGRVAGVRRNPDAAETNLIPVDLTIVMGNSGGPAYDKDGKVLGLADMVIADGAGGQVKFLVSSMTLCNAPPVAAMREAASN